MRRRLVFMLLVLGFLVTLPAETALAIDPREAVAAPAGTDFFQLYYVRNQGSDFYVKGTKTSDDAPFAADSTALRYGHYWGVGKDMVVLSSVFLPFYSDVTVSGAPVGNQQKKASGLGDPMAMFAFWPLADRENKQWLAGAFYVTAPFGDYDHARSVNVGKNVWTFRPELAWVKGWDSFYLQLVADLYFDTDNTRYGPAGRTLERDPLFAGEVHGSYTITRDAWVGLSWYYANGYQSKIQETGAYNNDRQNDHTIGLSVNYRFTKNVSLLLSSKYKAVTNNGFDQAEIFRCKATYAF